MSVEQQWRTWHGPRAPGAKMGGTGGDAPDRASEPRGPERRLDRIGPWALLLSAVAAAATLAAVYGMRIRGLVIFDEVFNVVGGRYIDQFPQALFESNVGAFTRGPERLTALLFAGGNELSGRTGTQLEIAHVLIAVAYAAAAVPTYAMARVAGLGRWWSAGAGTLAVFTPLLLFGATLLNTTLSLLTAAIASWAYLRTLVRPSWHADLVAVLATGLMATARVSYGGLGVALLIAVIVQALRDARRPIGAPRQLLNDHWLLIGVAAVAAIYVGIHGASQASGYAGVSAAPSLSEIWANVRVNIGKLAVAYALAPFAIALAWVLRAALRPRDRAAGAFAVLAVATFLVLAYVNQSSDLEDRYAVALLPVAAVAVVAPFARRELRWLEVGLAGVLVARAVSTTQSQQILVGFGHFLATTDTWFADVWLGRASSYLPFGRSAADTLVVVAAVVFAVALALIARRARHWARIAAVVLSLTAAIGFVGAWYSASKLVPAVAGVSTANPALHSPGFAQAAFVDERVHAPVGVLDYLTHEAGIPQQWTSVEMFNGRVQATIRVNGQTSGYTCCFHRGAMLGLNIDPNTGAVSVIGSSLPRYVLSAAQWLPGALVTELLATSPYTDPAVSLERIVPPLQAAWTGPGVPADGWGLPGQPLRLRVFPAALTSLRRPCLQVVLSAPPLPATGPLEVNAGTVHVAIPPSASIVAHVPLAPSAKRPQDILINASRVGIRNDGAHVTVGLSDVRVTSCPAR